MQAQAARACHWPQCPHGAECVHATDRLFAGPNAQAMGELKDLVEHVLLSCRDIEANSVGQTVEADDWFRHMRNLRNFALCCKASLETEMVQ